MKNFTPEFEDEIYKSKVLELEHEIEYLDKDIKEHTRMIHNKNLGSAEQRKVWYRLRRKRKKDRNKLMLKLDLMRK